MSSPQRTLLVLIVVLFLSGMTLSAAQQDPPKPPDKEPDPKAEKEAPAPDIALPAERRTPKVIAAAEDLIKAEAWNEATLLLQSLLDRKENLFVEVKRNGETHWVSVHREANCLLGSMPAKGLELCAKFMEIVGSSILIEGSALGSSAEASVSPTLTESMPAMQIMSPAWALSASILFSP